MIGPNWKMNWQVQSLLFGALLALKLKVSCQMTRYLLAVSTAFHVLQAVHMPNAAVVPCRANMHYFSSLHVEQLQIAVQCSAC